jgi:hypothetical protein
MSTLAAKSFDTPDEKRTPDKTEVGVVDLGGGIKAARMSMQPGWSWSSCIKPLVGGDSCQVHHVGTVVSGRLGVRHDDGSEIEVGPGEAYQIAPGHDAWVVGDSQFVAFEFDSSAATTYATLPA